jgi:hypothetical protein
MTSLSHLLLDLDAMPPSPTPGNGLPVGPARARALRLVQLREGIAEIDADAVAAAIARRAVFTRALAARLAAEARADSSGRPEAA